MGQGEVFEILVDLAAKNIPNLEESVLWNIDVSQFCAEAKSTIRDILNFIPTKIQNLYLHHIQFINLRKKSNK